MSTFSRSVSFSWSCLFSVSALDRACLTCFTSSSKPEMRAADKRWNVDEYVWVWNEHTHSKQRICTYPVDQRWSQSPGFALVSLCPARPAGWCYPSLAWVCCSLACSICPEVLSREPPAAAAVLSSLSELYAASQQHQILPAVTHLPHPAAGERKREFIMGTWRHVSRITLLLDHTWEKHLATCCSRKTEILGTLLLSNWMMLLTDAVYATKCHKYKIFT